MTERFCPFARLFLSTTVVLAVLEGCVLGLSFGLVFCLLVKALSRVMPLMW